jgi:ATP synthase protein I
MSDKTSVSRSRQAAFQRKVATDEERKLKSKHRGVQDIWMGLGTFGLIGWAITIPTFLGVLLGIYIDGHFPGEHSWTLSLLIVGLFLGCLNAWHWVAREEKAIREDEEAENE